jgi:hypothetical protein
LELKKADLFISRKALHQHERWFPLGVPSKLLKKLIGRRVLPPRFFIRAFAPWWFKKSMWAEDPDGVCYLIVAHKTKTDEPRRHEDTKSVPNSGTSS